MKKTTVAHISDFQKLDIRVGQVIGAEYLKNSNKLILLKVDLGADYGIIKVLTGLAKYYKTEDFIGKKFLFLANLLPRQMAGEVSSGMLLTANNDKQEHLLIEVSNKIDNGAIIE